jgi:integrase
MTGGRTVTSGLRLEPTRKRVESLLFPYNSSELHDPGRTRWTPFRTITALLDVVDQQARTVLYIADELVATGQLERPASLAIRLAAVTGARRSEIAALRWEDLRNGRLTIDSSIALIHDGKSRSGPFLRDDPTKTANRREIALDAKTLAELAVLRAEIEKYGPWILAIGELPVNPERVSAWWRRVRDIARVDPKWRLHDLRHWSATTSIAQGHDIRTVANRLGHANPSMTLRTYAHAVEAADAPVADTLGRLLDSD